LRQFSIGILYEKVNLGETIAGEDDHRYFPLLEKRKYQLTRKISRIPAAVTISLLIF
jgi:hypothetical protein